MEDCIKQKRHVHIYLQDYSFHNLLVKDKKNLAKNAESQQIYYLLIPLENIFYTDYLAKLSYHNKKKPNSISVAMV